jgi:hypothetical protein
MHALQHAVSPNVEKRRGVGTARVGLWGHVRTSCMAPNERSRPGKKSFCFHARLHALHHIHQRQLVLLPLLMSLISGAGI